MAARSRTDHDAGDRLSVCAPLRRRDRAERSCAGARMLGSTACSSRCLSRVRTLASRHTDRNPGFAPQQVEELVTKQVENAVNGAAGLATLRSESIPGLSVVTITFTNGVDVHIARQGISERLSESGSSLPAGVGTPKLSPLVSSTMDLLKIGLLSDKVDAYELRDTADWIIKPRLLAVPGVAHVIVFGGAPANPNLPNARSWPPSASLYRLSDAARAALPLRGAGFIDCRVKESCCDLQHRSRMPLRLGRPWLRCAAALPSCCATSPK